MRILQLFTICFLMISQVGISQNISITIDADMNKKAISPFIFGKNNNLSDDESTPTSESDFVKMRDAGLKFTREFGGNNGTKYNWRLKMTSHPDWYNNIYSHDWDFAASELEANLPGVQGMWAFQLLGFAASNKDNNFNDWAYNGSQWWNGACQNLAGGGEAKDAGDCAATTEGDPNLYLQKWTADSTVGILNHWFDETQLGYDKNNFQYWSMDNEPEIWEGTHDDVMSTQIDAEAFMQRYFETAKKARALYPDIKICGPVAANEWQWYAWSNKTITYNSKTYSWLEYFILRCAEEQKTSGIRLVDVIDLHFYPIEKNNSDILQVHKVFFDKNYSYPSANGVKVTGTTGWDNSLTKEYIFERCNMWLTQYMGANHNVGLGLTEFAAKHNSASVTAVCYASMLGTFANNEVELFSPWNWENGMWETMHLFSRYSKNLSIKSVSNNEDSLSAYTSINAEKDSMTVILVNRSQSTTQKTSINISNYSMPNGKYKTLQLANLPEKETFVSHTENALVSSTVEAKSGSFAISLPPLSITAVVLSAKPINETKLSENSIDLKIYPIPCKNNITIQSSEPVEKIEIYNSISEKVMQTISENSSTQIDLGSLDAGVYFFYIYTNDEVIIKEVVKMDDEN